MIKQLKNKKLLLVIVGVLVLLVAVGGGYYYVKNREKPNNGNNQNNNQNQTQQASTTEELGNGWIKYTNNEYGFSFEAPDYWRERIDNQLKTGNSDSTLCFNQKDFEKPYMGCSQLGLHVYTKSITGKDINTWYKDLETDQYFGMDEILDREKTTINGSTAWKLKLMGENGTYRFMVNPEENYLLSIVVAPGIEIENEIVQRILNTLNFQ